MFRESDECRAVQRFYEWQAESQPASTVTVTANVGATPGRGQLLGAIDAMLADHDARRPEKSIHFTMPNDGNVRVSQKVDSPLLWGWLREQIIDRPEYVAQQTGLPELARLADLPRPKPSPRPADLGTMYERYADVGPAQQRNVRGSGTASAKQPGQLPFAT